MAIYQTANGQQTEATMEQQLRAAGWQGGEDVASAYARTTGGAVTPAMAGSGGGGTVISGGTAVNTPGVSSNEQAVLDAFKASSGLSIKDLNERKRQFDEDLAFKKQQWEQAGLPAAEVARRVQEAQIAEIQSQIQLATANVTGYYQTPVQPVDPSQFAAQDQATKDTYLRYNGNNPQAAAAKWAQDATRAVQQAAGPGTPTEAARQFNARLGLDYMTQAAQMGGPADYFAQSNFFRGAQGNSQVPAMLSALQQGVTMPTFGATGTQAPDVQSTANLASRLTGMPQPGGTTTPAGGDAALGLIGAIGRTGGTGLAPQAIEQLTPDELALFGSGLKASGFSMPTFLQSYRQSRIGQNAAVPLG